MKKIFTTLYFTLAIIFCSAQGSLRLLDTNDVVIDQATLSVIMPTLSSHTQEILVTNTSSVGKSYKVKRTIFAIDAADATQFCWGGLCYGFTTNLSSLTLTVAPGDTVDFVGNGFHGIFNSGTASMTRFVHYNFYDVSAPGDSSGVTVQYTTFVGINEQDKVNGTISNAFPNPSTSFVSIKYDMNEFSQNGKIVFYDMLGKKVKEVELADRKGTAKINVADMNAGLYFYTFVIDDKAIATKKVVISH